MSHTPNFGDYTTRPGLAKVLSLVLTPIVNGVSSLLSTLNMGTPDLNLSTMPLPENSAGTEIYREIYSGTGTPFSTNFSFPKSNTESRKSFLPSFYSPLFTSIIVSDFALSEY